MTKTAKRRGRGREKGDVKRGKYEKECTDLFSVVDGDSHASALEMQLRVTCPHDTGNALALILISVLVGG